MRHSSCRSTRSDSRPGRSMILAGGLALFLTAGAAGAENYFVVPPCRAVRSHLLTGFQETVPIRGTCGVPATAQSVSFTLSEFDAGFDGVILVRGTGINLLFEVTPKINWKGGQNRSQHFISQLGTSGSLNVSAGLAGGVVSFTVDVDGYFE